jgi:hypothetical protein
MSKAADDATRLCRFCSTKLIDKSRYCYNCGKLVADDTEFLDTFPHRAAIWAGVYLISACLLYPPWVVHYQTQTKNFGYSSIFIPPQFGELEVTRLLVECAVIVLVVATFIRTTIYTKKIVGRNKFDQYMPAIVTILIAVTAIITLKA